MGKVDKLFFDIFDIPYINLAASKSIIAAHPDYINMINRLSITEQYSKLREFAESLLLVEDLTFSNLEEELTKRLKAQESKAGATYSQKIYEMIPRVIKEIKKKHPEKVEVLKSEEDKQKEQQQIKEVYEDIKSKEGPAIADWLPQKYKEMLVEKESYALPNKYVQILSNRG